ncbi:MULTISPECIES: hypothetical protein [unclassified Microcoleus]|uniref:hypothetical protein n=1 Tax=unclassified Microcoleus TaxID=2642155 RepID=UPI0025DC7E1A|nr:MULTISPECIES: hypothetical protein [unclassified Microcoleus]
MAPQSNLNAIAQPAIDPKELEKLVKLSGRRLWVAAVLGLTFPIFAYIYTKRRLAAYIAFLLSGLMGLLTLFIVFSRPIPNGSTLPITAFYTVYLLVSLGITLDNCAAILRSRKQIKLLTGETPWKTSNNQQVKNGRWPAWFPYPSSWLRALGLTLWIAVVVRVVTFWIAVIGITLSAVEQDINSFWRGLELIVPVSVAILSYIHHILFFDEAKTPYTRWLPSPRSLWEGVYAPIVALLSLIMVVVLLLPFFPIVPSCNYGADFELASCLSSHQADVSNYLSTIAEVSAVIWIVTSAYLYQIDYLIRNSFSLKTLAELILLGFVAFLAVSASSLLSKNPEARQAINFPEPTKVVPSAVNSEPTPSLPTAPIAKPLSPTPQTVKSDSFGNAVNKATNAANLAQNAQTETQWQAVVAEWQNAIALMKAVPPSSDNYDVAQNRVVQYQENLAAIKRRISRPFQQGIDAAQNAAFFAKTAKSKAEWEFVATHWEEALASMKSVPPSNSNYAVAKNRVIQYQQNLNAARLAVSRAK